MWHIRLFGARVMAHDFDRQEAELQIRAAIEKRFTALGTPQTRRVGSLRSGKGKLGLRLICATEPRMLRARALVTKAVIGKRPVYRRPNQAHLAAKVPFWIGNA